MNSTMRSETVDYEIRTFSVDTTTRGRGSSFSLKLPCTPFTILGIESANGELLIRVALPTNYRDQQNYRFFLYEDQERVYHFQDSYLGSFRAPTGKSIHVFGPKNGYVDPNVRWMGLNPDAYERRPEFILRRTDDPPPTSVGIRFEE